MKKILAAVTALGALSLTLSAKAQEVPFTSYTYGNKTVLEFSKTPRNLTVRDENGATVIYERISDSTYRLGRQLRYFTAEVNGKVHVFGEKPSSPVAAVQEQAALPVSIGQPAVQPAVSAPAVTQAPALVRIPMVTANGVQYVYAPASAVSTAEEKAVVPVQSSLSKDEKLVKPSPAPAQAQMPVWSVKPDHASIEDVINDWAKQAGYEVFYETQQLPISRKTERVIPANSFLEALSILGESYRNSGAPFQVIPTDHKQVIIRPMEVGTIENQ